MDAIGSALVLTPNVIYSIVLKYKGHTIIDEVPFTYFTTKV